MAEQLACAMFNCRKKFSPYEGMRKDSQGEYWCKECQDEFDGIDWEEVYYNSHSYYEPPC